jgi:thymidylate synthase
MESFDIQYIELCKKILNYGDTVIGRGGLKYTQVFGEDICVDLRDEFPLLTLRKLPLKNIYREFMWDIQGHSKVEFLGKAKHFWDFLAIDGWLPGSYGASWRSWPISISGSVQELKTFRSTEFDQLKYVYDELKTNPLNRQLVVQTYNPSVSLDYMKCPPCHPSMVFSSNGTYLDLLVLGRSQDLATGLPLDIVRYSLLTKKMAEDSELYPRFVKISIANAHIYSQNQSQIEEIIERDPRGGAHMQINAGASLWELDPEIDFQENNYYPHPAVKMEVAK